MCRAGSRVLRVSCFGRPFVRFVVWNHVAFNVKSCFLWSFGSLMMVDPCHYSLRLCLKGCCVFCWTILGVCVSFYMCLACVSEVCEDYGRLWIVW